MDFLLVIALLAYLSGAFYSVVLFATRSDSGDRYLIAILSGGFAAHTVSLILSWSRLGYFPVVNPKEVASFIAWAIVLYYLVIRARYSVRALPTFVIPVVFVFMLVSLLLPDPAQAISPMLEGAIEGNSFGRWILPLHVTLLIFSYAAFVLTFLGGVMYLVQEHELKAKTFGSAFYRLPALNTCDEISYLSLTIGFVLLTLGMISGMIWNNQRDGRFWHYDPKEVLALVTWITYLLMIHYRLAAGWRGRRTGMARSPGLCCSALHMDRCALLSRVPRLWLRLNERSSIRIKP